MKSIAILLLTICIIGSVSSKSIESKSLLDTILGHHHGCIGPMVDCFADPCMMSTCSDTSAVRCVSNFCNGCNADWYDGTGNILSTC